MTRTLYINGQVLLPDGFSNAASIEVDGDRIAAVHHHARPQLDCETVDLEGDCLTPGFIDVQVNGGKGVLFNDAPTLEGLTNILSAHSARGTTALMPTLISDDLDVIRSGVAAVDQAIARGVPGVLGIHIEGPFLNREKCGIHDPAKFRTLNDEMIDLLSSLKHGKTLVTLAPEMCTTSQITALTKRGVIVSLGHSNGTYEDAVRAINGGASGFTHLFNAMSPLTSRQPGLVGAALESSDVWTSVIVDGFHVSPTVLKLALKSRPLNKMMLITDAMPNIGTQIDHFYLQGRKIFVEDGACRDEHGTLAGAALDMGLAVRNSISMLGISAAEAINMASKYPAQFLGIDDDFGEISVGKRADFVRLNSKLEVIETIIGSGQTWKVEAEL